ncbi:MAG TPA: hypothetical protein VGE64_02170 [Xanthomonadaceae bacterium]|uniref:Uncharacterized protein n=1 Tax=Lysobacter hankyongensis TaxID=1176535 RepID=A0ABP9BLY6_9GAMM
MDKERVVEIITQLVSELGPITGSKLSSLLRKADGSWNPSAYGVPTLGVFISSFVPQVSEVGRAGLDPLYGIHHADRDIVTAAVEDIWRAWSSPNSKLAVEVSASTGELRTVERHQPITTGWARLATPDADAHRSMARDFIALQFPSGDPELSELITPDTYWWQTWFKQIRQRKLARVWSDFRRARLFAEFERAVSLATISPEADASARLLVRRWGSLGAELHETLALRSESPNKSELRTIAMLAIEEMNDDELLALRLPLGLVLRAIKRNR